MEAVVASLEKRLRDNGGGDGDWELLAKSYEFLKRTDAAALARAHRLPDASTAGAAVSQAATSTQMIAAPKAAAAPAKLSAESERLLTQAEAARQKRDFKAAEKIYAQLAAREQMTAQSWADYADVAASLNNNSLSGKPSDYVQRALQLDPAHPKALWLQGSLEHASGQYAAAVVTWRKLLAVMDANSSDAKLIRGNIEEDTRLAGGAVAPARPVVAQAAGGAAASGLRVSGEVTVSRALQSRVRAGQVLYILAKSVNSPGMPVAVRRVETGAWPVRFELSDSDAMVPERRLSSVGPVTVEARISQGGQANSAPGDLLGATPPLDPAKAGALHLVIDREVR
jgi:tetratricopeptide (TPR) repeat protein